MERTKKANVDPTTIPLIKFAEELIRWKKIGGGSLRLGAGKNCRIIKPGQIFTAFISEIPPAFRKSVISLDGTVVFEEPKKAVVPILDIVTKPVYTIEPKGKSLFLFDVKDSLGKVVSEKSLKKEAAELLVVELLK